jgi:hypothetical protein
MPRDSVLTTLPPPNARSRVGNGRAVFPEGVDGRSLRSRRIREVLSKLLSDIPTPSGAQEMTALHAAFLHVWAEAEEARFIGGQTVDIGALTTAANSLRRLLTALPAPYAALDITSGARAPGKGPESFTVEYVPAKKPNEEQLCQE